MVQLLGINIHHFYHGKMRTNRLRAHHTHLSSHHGKARSLDGHSKTFESDPNQPLAGQDYDGALETTYTKPHTTSGIQQALFRAVNLTK